MRKHISLSKFAAVAVMLMSMFLVSAVSVYAIPAEDSFIRVTQPGGQEIMVRALGDEFLNWFEDQDGNLLVYDEEKGGFCYGVWTDEGSVSTGLAAADSLARMSRALTTKSGDIPQALINSVAAKREQMMQEAPAGPGLFDPANEPEVNAVSALLSDDATELSGPEVANPYALQRQLLVLHITWEDTTFDHRNPQTGEITRRELPERLTDEQIYDIVFNSEKRENDPALQYSVNSYYMGAFESDGIDIVLPAKGTGIPESGVVTVALPGSHPNYDSGGWGTTVSNALKKAVAEYGLNLREFKSDYIPPTGSAPTGGYDNMLYAYELGLAVIVHGYEGSFSRPAGIPQNLPRLWGHSSTSGSGIAVLDDPVHMVDGVPLRINNYFSQGSHHYYWDEYHYEWPREDQEAGPTLTSNMLYQDGVPKTDPVVMGIIAHEMGHGAYRFADVYDYFTIAGRPDNFIRSGALGYWSTMSGGSWNAAVDHNRGTAPALPEPYNLEMYGIVKPGIIDPAIGAENIVMESPLDIWRVNSLWELENADRATNQRIGEQFFYLQHRVNQNQDLGTFNWINPERRNWAIPDNYHYDEGDYFDIYDNTVGGVLIYHVDMGTTVSRVNDKPSHRRVGIEEAHGGQPHLEISENYEVGMVGVSSSGTITFDVGPNFGTYTDMWGNGKDRFAMDTDPSSALHDRFVNNYFPRATQEIYSGVDIYDIAYDPVTQTSSFSVAPLYDAMVSPTTAYSFGEGTIAGGPYVQPEPQQFTITNTSDAAMTNLAAALSNGNNSAFVITADLSATSIAPGESVTISVQPKDDLQPRNELYTDRLVITWDEGSLGGIPITLEFKVKTYTVRVTSNAATVIPGSTELYDFNLPLGVYTKEELNVEFRILNIGSGAVEDIVISLLNGDASPFEIVSQPDFTAIGPDRSVNFSVQPKADAQYAGTNWVDTLVIEWNNGGRMEIPMKLSIGATTDLYAVGFVPEGDAMTVNGVTATGVITPAGDQAAGKEITVTVTFDGVAEASGVHTVEVRSETLEEAGVAITQAQTKQVTSGTDLTGALGNTMTFTFVMPGEAVTDLEVIHEYTTKSLVDVINNGVALNNLRVTTTTARMVGNSAVDSVSGLGAYYEAGDRIRITATQSIVASTDVTDTGIYTILLTSDKLAAHGVEIEAPAIQSRLVQQTLNQSPSVSASYQFFFEIPEGTDVDDLRIHIVYGSVDEMIITPENPDMTKGDSQQFDVEFIGTGEYPTDVNWTVIGQTDAETYITEDGVLYVGEGEDAEEITVRATLNVNYRTSSDAIFGETTVTVRPPAESVKINATALTVMYLEDTLDLTATVYPLEALQIVEWSTTHPNVVEIDQDGHVVAVGTGMCVITATAQNGVNHVISIRVI